MSNMQPNPYNNAPGPVQGNVNRGPQVFNHNPLNQVPSSQLPPGYGSKSDPNSNSPIPSVPQKSVISQVQNVNYNQSGNSSPAFNQPGIMPPSIGLQSSPLHPMKTVQNPTLPPSSSVSPMSMSNNTSPYPSNFISQPQINANAPPLIPSSQYNKPLLNGPTLFSQPPNQNVSTSSNLFSAPSLSNNPVNAAYPPRPVNQAPVGSVMPIGQVTSQSGALFTGPPTSSLPRNSPQIPGPPISGPPSAQPLSGPPLGSGPPTTFGVNGPGSFSGQSMPFPGQVRAPMAVVRPPMQPPLGPPANQPYSGMHINGPPNSSQGFSALPRPPVSGPYKPGPIQNIPQAGQQSYQPLTQHVGPPIVPPGPPAGPTSGPTSNMQNRYPQMPQASYGSQQPPMPPGMSNQYPQYNEQGVTQQMGQLSVTRQGFDQLWGHQLVDLMQTRHILPEYPDDPPEIRLGHQFADAPNCSPEIFRCTVNRIPESNSLLQKSRLPLGILIHPFKDLNHLPVIQCATIVRCRACRTYINPFVYFVDSKRWKCNLCYRVNDLPEEFQYDPVSKSYGEPSRRPEVKSATIEFIAPGEYMLRPPQPAVYLFLLDVSQMARESGYLQVFCDTLREHLDQLPGDARTQVGFVCYDEHVHFYLLGDGLARPKEMTVLDVEDVFLPSPSSLLVNLGERREVVCELLAALPARHGPAPGPGPGGCALGAALQAAYKLMAPTGGRITVLQTCLPNVGPGALKPREDPNARSSAAVAHLSPATDFYKRLALECSGAQVAVDLFLLNSQYCDLATLSGMSQFSAGSVYHIPLFRASAPPLALRLRRQLARYFTRKIGFEAVMRVRTTRGISIHTFHGNFFVRSTDLLSLPNVSPDAGFGMQLSIDESLADLQQVCFQAALLYTSSKGERRIRVHTLALPIANTLPEVLHSADQQCIIGLLSKMAVDRCVSATMSEAREALSNVGVDALSALRLAHPAHARAHPGLLAPHALRLLPLYLNALLKRKAFRTGTSTRLDDRVFDMCSLKSQPLSALIRAVYPDLYPVHALHEYERERDHERDSDHDGPDPPRLHLTAERVNSTGAYLLDDGETMVVYVGHAVSAAFLADTWGARSFAELPDGLRAPPAPASPLAALLDRLNEDRPCPADLLLVKDNSPSKNIFTDRLVDDRVESSFSYYEFLQHLKSQVK